MVKNFFISVCVILAGISFPLNMDAQALDEGYLLNYWIYSSSESSRPRETYRLRTFDFNVPSFHLGGGTEFCENNIVRKFHVRLCGNDQGPRFTQGTWKIFQDKKVRKLKIKFPGEEESLFVILEIAKDKLVLQRLK